jgi:serine/threonine protein kinase
MSLKKLGKGLVSVYALNDHEVVKKVKRHRVSAAVVREIAALTALSHPNLLKLISCDLVRGELVLERAKEDCQKWHKRVGKISDEALDSMMDQLTAGLAHMHQCGVAHMDIKPHNVLRWSGNHFKIADFGLSCSMLYDPSAWTLDFRPPEVVRFDMGNYPKPTNVWACESWALGMMFLNMWFPDPDCMLCSTSSDDDRRQMRKLNRVFGVYIDPRAGPQQAREFSSTSSSGSCSGCSACDARDSNSSEDEATPSSSSEHKDDKEESTADLESDEETLLHQPPDTQKILEKFGERVFIPRHWDYVDWYLQVDPNKRKLIAEPGFSTILDFPPVRATKRRWSTVCTWMFECACGSDKVLDPTVFLLALQCARYYVGQTKALFTEMVAIACYAVASKYMKYDFTDFKKWREASEEDFSFKRFVQETRDVLNTCAGMLHCEFLPRCDNVNLNNYLIQQILEPKFVRPGELVKRGSAGANTLRNVTKLMKYVTIKFSS